MFRFMSFERTVNFVTEMKLFEFNLMAPFQCNCNYVWNRNVYNTYF